MLAALIVVGGLLSVGTAPTVAQSMPVKCELHVWGAGFPGRKMPKRLEAHLRKTNPPETFDVGNPVSNTIVFNTIKRAHALPDASLGALLPAGTEVTVIRHDVIIDQQATPLKKMRARLHPSSSGCYADVVVADNYAICSSTRKAQDGVLKEATAAVLAGGDRFVIRFWMQRFATLNAAGQTFTKTFDSPVAYAPPNSTENAEAVKNASEKNLDQFVTFVSGRTQ